MKRILVFVLSFIFVLGALLPAAAAENGEVTMPPVDETTAPATTAPATTDAQDALTVEEALPWIITVLTTLIAAMMFYVVYLRGKNASRF